MYRFGLFEFDGHAGELRRSGRLVPLEPQPARALALLVARAGQIVSRDELKAAIWGPDTHVDFDRGLAYCLSQVRTALGDTAENPRYVQTLPRKGYRFIAPVESHAAPIRPAESAGLPETAARQRPASGLAAIATTVIALMGVIVGLVWLAANRHAPAVVAVSVFDNETGLAEHDQLVASMSDMVTLRLSEIDPDRLQVIGNSAALRQPRNIRNLQAVRSQVHADYVVLGQLQKAERGLRFVTHLIRLSDETHLKANRIELPDGDVSRLEAAVVAEFERAVREHVLAEPVS